MRTHVLKTLAVAFVVAATFFGQAQSAEAQTTSSVPKGDKIDGEIAGIVGLGFIGLDIGLILPPMVGLHDQTWAYVVFPLVLTGAGVGTGVAVTDSFDRAVNISLIVSGTALFIPALVGSLAWRNNKREREVQQADRGVIRLGSVSLHAPSVSAAPVYSPEERQRWGMAQRNSTRVTLLSGTF